MLHVHRQKDAARTDARMAGRDRSWREERSWPEWSIHPRRGAGRAPGWLRWRIGDSQQLLMIPKHRDVMDDLSRGHRGLLKRHRVPLDVLVRARPW